MRVANGPFGAPMRLRGLHVRVVSEGTVRVGDAITRVEVPANMAG